MTSRDGVVGRWGGAGIEGITWCFALTDLSCVPEDTEGARGGERSEYNVGKAFTKGRIGLSSVRPFPEVLRGEASREDSLDPLGWVGSIVNDVFSQACVGCRTLFTHKRRGGTWGSSCLFPPDTHSRFSPQSSHRQI